jgi:Ca2+-binding EF-hand superfamily protein
MANNLEVVPLSDDRYTSGVQLSGAGGKSSPRSLDDLEALRGKSNEGALKKAQDHMHDIDIDENELASKSILNEAKRQERAKEREARKAERMKNEKFSLWGSIRSIFITEYSIPEEELEEYRMLSGLEPEYICKLHDYFLDETGDENSVMTKEMFEEIPFVEVNPLRDRLALCFGFENEITEMNFELFLQGVALFNSHGKREEKLKIAFKMHDFDNDNQISKSDLLTYLDRVTGDRVPGTDKADIVDEVFRESSSDPKGQYLSFQDFSRVLAPTDFHTNISLPF